MARQLSGVEYFYLYYCLTFEYTVFAGAVRRLVFYIYYCLIIHNMSRVKYFGQPMC